MNLIKTLRLNIS